MNKYALIGLVLVVTLLAGCSGTQGSQAGAGLANQGAGSDLSPVMTLSVGTLALEGGDLAVEAAEAAQLLPLWKGYRALSQDSATAPVELEALVAQIEETMTPEQQQAIEAMALTSADVLAVTEEEGTGSTVRAAAGGQTSATQGTAAGGGAPPDGMPGAGGPPDGGIPGMGGQASGSTGAASTAASSQVQLGGNANAMLISVLDVLIEVLEARA